MQPAVDNGALSFAAKPLPWEVERAVAHLLRAYDYARDARVDPWQLAVPLGDLRSAGLSPLDVRWLILKGHVAHAQETTLPGEPHRTFRPLPAPYLPEDACLTLTPAGAAELRPLIRPNLQSLPDCCSDRAPVSAAVQSGTTSPQAFPNCLPTASPQSAALHVPSTNHLPPATSPPPASPPGEAPAPKPAKVLPTWNPQLRELWYDGHLIKRYRVPADAQECILNAFQEDGWPDCIDDPLPPKAGVNPQKRLAATIKSLNRNQHRLAIRFHGNGNGAIIVWEPMSLTL